MATKDMMRHLADYSEYSTIQGLVYIFQRRQTWFGRIFWIIIVLVMLSLGICTSIDAYNAWQQSPILTTLTSTAYPIGSIEFPAFTICSQGMNNDVMKSATMKQFKLYLDSIGYKLNATVYEAASVFYRKV